MPPDLTNNETCPEAHVVAPAETEQNHLAAARLTPPSYPYVVTGIQYVLNGGAQGDIECQTGLAHQVHVFKGPDVTPPATIENDTVIDVDLGQAVMVITVVQQLVTPITLEQGEHLFIAVQMAGTHPDVLCVGACSGPAYQEDRNYWSNAADPPYPWPTLGSFGLKMNYRFDALGHAQ
jgi:hypothetical protein